MSKTYTVPDLFFNKWEDVSAIKKTELWPLIKEYNIRKEQLLHPNENATTAEIENTQLMYGVVLIAILRVLRKRPLLVDKIDVPQAVDCMNELTFMNESWLEFPVEEIAGFKCPGDRMHRITFDQFIYALKEYYLLMESKDVTSDMNRLARLTATLYMPIFEPNLVEGVATFLDKNAKPWQLLSVLYTFTNILEYITTVRCKVLFTGGKGSGSEHPVAVWLKIKYRLGESGYFQGHKDVESAPIYKALDYLCDLQSRKDGNTTH